MLYLSVQYLLVKKLITSLWLFLDYSTCFNLCKVSSLFHPTIPVPRNRRECLSTLLRCLLAVTFLSQKYSVLLTLVKRALSGEFVTHSLFCFLNLYIHSVEAVMEAVKAALHLCQQKNDYSSSSSSSFWKLHLE